MKNNFVSFLFFTCIISVKAFAADIAVENDDGVTVFYNWINNKTELGVTCYYYDDYTYYSGYEDLNSITIPETISINGNEYSVTSIESHAFFNCSNLTSIALPYSVTSIGDLAFQGCSSLAYITIPNKVINIGNQAFQGCYSLTSITIPNNVINIGNRAFQGCYSLTSIDIPESVTSIGQSAFSDCSNLTSITVASGNTNYDSRDNCNAIIETFSQTLISGCINTIIPTNVKSIGRSAFSRCTGLTTITIPNSVTSIGDYAFMNCTSLSSFTIPNSVTNIGRSAFSGCSGLTTVVIPNSVANLGIHAFRNCSGLISITIGNNVTSIGERTFEECHSLNSVIIGNSVTSIGGSAFFNTRIKSLTIGSSVTSISSSAFAFDSSKGSQPIKTIWLTNTPPSGYTYAAGTINYVSNDQFSFLSNWKQYPFLSSTFDVDGVKYVPLNPSERTCDVIDCLYDETVENIVIGSTVSYKGVDMTVKNINPYTFCNNIYIKNAEINSFGILDNYVFAECIALETCILGENVTSINESAFKNCSSLQQIIIPNSVEKIGSYAFINCIGLQTAIIGDGVRIIDSYAFENCFSLTHIEIPPSVNSIKNYTFKGCIGLATVIIADRENELELGSNGNSPLFANCPLDYVYIGGNISYNTSSSYGYSPFFRNVTLRTVVITDKETEISPNEFYGCTGLKNVRIGEGVTIIGSWAFSGCSNLDYFAFGSKVESIGKEAFSDCVNITKIISHASTPPSCEAQALDDISKWNCILYIPIGSLPYYQEASQWKEFFFMEEGDETTSIHYSMRNEVDEQSDQCSINHNNSWYLPDGRRLSSEPTTRGLYIYKGKKVFLP